jgi:hypothetical protein
MFDSLFHFVSSLPWHKSGFRCTIGTKKTGIFENSKKRFNQQSTKNENTNGRIFPFRNH